VKPKGRKKIIYEIYIFIHRYKKRAKQRIVFYSNDDYRCYKRIRALADLFPYNENQMRCKLINEMIQELWILYYFYKINCTNRKVSYENIKKRYL